MTDGASDSRSKRSGPSYLGLLLVALSTLMLEILVTRISSVISWYHLAFFVISLAMLGMTAGAVLVFVLPGSFEDDCVPKRMAQAALAFALTTPVALAFAMSRPLLPVDSFMDFVALLAFAGALAIPFSVSGVVLTLALTRAGLPASVAYGVDLLGAGLGCALVIGLLGVVDAPSGVLVCASVAAAAAVAFAFGARARGLARVSGVVALGLGLLAVANASISPTPLRPAWVKGVAEDPELFAFVGWNTYSRVTVDETRTDPPYLWSESRTMPEALAAPIEQRSIRIDGAAATMLAKGSDELDRHAYLDWDVTSFAHYLRPTGPAAVIGVGGGRDVVAAARAGHQPVVGVELNSLIVDLHRRRMADFSGLTQIEGVELVADEARSFMARDDRKYSVITMSLIDTWASTGAGSYSLSENGLYTTDAWWIFARRLEPDGIFTVSRWYHPKAPGETARMLALGMDVLWRGGVTDPRQHLILLQNDQVATLMLSPQPFRESDLDEMQRMAKKMSFNTIATPRRAPQNPLLDELWQQPDQSSMHAWTANQQLDLTPPTDDRPFFFNMLKPSTWLRDPGSVSELDVGFLGNLQATQTLVYAVLVSILLTILTVVAPLWIRREALRRIDRRLLAVSGMYFAAIGLGFMFVEIALLSRLNVFLGHPTLSLAVLLGGIITFTGVGSLLSNRLDLDHTLVARAYPLVPLVLVLVSAFAMNPLMRAFVGSGLVARVMVGLGSVALPALGLGLCFPLGLRLVQRQEPALGPWLWAINGAFGVCASGLALGCSMTYGISTTTVVGALCYALLPFCTWQLAKGVAQAKTGSLGGG